MTHHSELRPNPLITRRSSNPLSQQQTTLKHIPAGWLSDETMFENLCTLPLSGALLSQALHPTEPILTVGLYNGRVQSFRLPPALQPQVEDLAKGTDCLVTDGKATIETLWETRRHKRGCRGLAYTPDGDGECLCSSIWSCTLLSSRTNEK